jgi:hypothetical protein
MTVDRGLLQYHDPHSWAFYVYGEDDDGDPLFGFWMNIDETTGFCAYERNGGHGKWLGTEHQPEEYAAEAPTDELRECIRDAVVDDRGVDIEKVLALPAHETYFFQVVHGTIEQKHRASPALEAFIEECVGNEVSIREP